jgi:predicted phage terminase large subunit-like protein
VGGIGSGKSFCGALDLIRRGKPGRTYLVLAPTYTVLQDATFRSFVHVADQLGVLDRKQLKRGAPPAARLRTGCEVLFRSADDPDHLRGPNVSGCWLDEASLMPREAFEVALGRLREGGEQGWLTATFTPKGKQHWTYEVFGQGAPGAAVFHSTTAANPFLPPTFESTVRGQYTSRLAAQELGGAFTDVSGGLFDRSWFQVIDSPPPLKYRVRAWDLAATPKDERAARDPDWTAGALLGKVVDGTVYVLDVARRRASPSQVEQLVRLRAELDGKPVPVIMEQEPGSSGKALADHYLRRVLAGYNFRTVRSTGGKATRALPLAAAAEGGLVRLVRGHWNREFLDEVEAFPQGAHDDQVDATSLAFTSLASKKTLWLSVGGERITGDAARDDAREAEQRRLAQGKCVLSDERIWIAAAPRSGRGFGPGSWGRRSGW